MIVLAFRRRCVQSVSQSKCNPREQAPRGADPCVDDRLGQQGQKTGSAMLCRGYSALGQPLEEREIHSETFYQRVAVLGISSISNDQRILDFTATVVKNRYPDY